MTRLLYIFLSIFTISARAEDNATWQKLNLEREIESRIQEGALNMLPREKYILSVSLSMTPPMTREQVREKIQKEKNFSENSGDDLALSKLGFWNSLLIDDLVEEEMKKQSQQSDRVNALQVKLILDNTVTAEQSAALETSLKAKLTDLLPNITPKIEITKTNLMQTSPGKQWWEWLWELKTEFFIMAAALLSIFLLTGGINKGVNVLARAFQDGISILSTEKREEGAPEESEVSASMDNKNPETPAEQEEDLLPSSYSAKSGKAPPDAFQRFRELLAKSPAMATYLIKKWINSRTALDAKALKVITEYATIEEMQKLFGSFDPNMKKAARRLMSLPTGPTLQAVTEGLDYINRQLTELFVNPRPAISEAHISIIDAITESEFLDMYQHSADAAAFILSVLDIDKVSLLFSKLDATQLRKISDRARNYTDTELNGITENTVLKLKTIRDAAGKKPMLMEKYVELAPIAGPAKETVLYEIFSKSKEWDLIRDLAKKSFPALLISRTPKEVIQALLARMTPRGRLELIASQSGELRNFLMDCVGEPGIKAREIFEAELQDIEAVPETLGRLQSESEKFLGSLTNKVRRLQGSNEVIQQELNRVVDEWVAELRSSGELHDIREAA